jgi:hypothetical protein
VAAFFQPAHLFAVIPDRLNRAAFHRLTALFFFRVAGRLLYDEGMTVLRVHAEMIGRRENAGVTGNALFVDVETPGDVFDEFFGLISHDSQCLNHLARSVILSFPPKNVTPIR